MGDRPFCAAHNNGGATFDVYLPDCPCNKPPPDPRDARIAELEAALAGLVDALPRCSNVFEDDSHECKGRATHSGVCDTVNGYACHPCRCRSCREVSWTVEAEVAGRALGRRK